MNSKINVLLTLCILIILSCSNLQQAGANTYAEKQSNVIDNRHLTYFSEMHSYAKTSQRADWMIKIYPSDTFRLDDALYQDSFIKVYVSDVKDKILASRAQGATRNVAVYVPSERIVESLSNVPHSYFSVSTCSPDIAMIVDKAGLRQIAENPCVYCIMILPVFGDEPLSLSVDDAKVFDNLAFTMNKHCNQVNAYTHIAVIDGGYDPGQSPFADAQNPNIHGVARNNINYTWDFTDSNSDVTDGYYASHGTKVLELIARTLGDTGLDDTNVYQDPTATFYVLKVANDSGYYKQCEYDAIKWCVDNPDVDIVCMSWGSYFMGYLGYYFLPYPNAVCQNWACEQFEVGAIKGMTFVAGTGNEDNITLYDGLVRYPASSHYVIGVGSYDQVDGLGRGVKEYRSSYGTVNYNDLNHNCAICSSVCANEFKPNIYECGDNDMCGSGTSFAGPLVCANIALNCYVNGGPRSMGYETFLSVLGSCTEHPIVLPSGANSPGHILDADVLWHQGAYNLKVGSISSMDSIASAAAPSFAAYFNSVDPLYCVNTVSLLPSYSDVYEGVRTGALDVGLIDRPPTYEEMQNNPDLQIYAIGWNGYSDLLWAVTDGSLLHETPGAARSIWISYLLLPNLGFIPYPLDPIDFTGYFGYPDGNIDWMDCYFMIGAESSFSGSGILTPQCDLNADGHIDSTDEDLFWQYYYS